MDEIHTLKIPNTEFYLCGGSVRDRLLGKEPKDKDYVCLTFLKFPEMVEALKEQGAEIYQAKPEFLTIRCKIGKEVVDITYPRKDGNYSDGRHPDKVEVAQTLEEDSKRRDFRMNALYLDKDGKVIDFHGGQEDIKNKLVCCVGDPQKRMCEDSLRALRAIRFAVTLGFAIEQDTGMEVFRTLATYQTSMRGVSGDRIREEINKALKYPSLFFYIMSLWQVQDAVIYLMESNGLRFEVTAKG